MSVEARLQEEFRDLSLIMLTPFLLWIALPNRFR